MQLCEERGGLLVLRAVLSTGDPGRHVDILLPPGLAVPLADAVTEAARQLR